MAKSMGVNGRRVLVTGAAGFLGSHLCARLLSRSDVSRVIGIDNLYSGVRENLRHVEKDSRFSFHHHDVVEPFSADVDEIFNLACPASPVAYQFDPVATVRTSVLGAANMLELARECDARILQASTSEVYGDPTVSPQREDYWGNVNPVGLRSCYDEGKRCAETLFADYRRQYGTDIRIIRIFNTYGPQMQPDDGRVVSNFIIQALSGLPITVYGEGKQTRSFCYVDDLITGMLAFMESDTAETGPLNLGNPFEIPVIELAQRIINLTGSSSKIIFEPLPQDDPLQRRPDISKAASILGWMPQVPLESGLVKTIAYFDEVLRMRTGHVAIAE